MISAESANLILQNSQFCCLPLWIYHCGWNRCQDFILDLAMTYQVNHLFKINCDLADAAVLNCFYWLVLKKSVVKNALLLDGVAVNHLLKLQYMSYHQFFNIKEFANPLVTFCFYNQNALRSLVYLCKLMTADYRKTWYCSLDTIAYIFPQLETF